MRRTFALVVLGLKQAACATPSKPPPSLDPTTVMIDAERLLVISGKARDGLAQAAPSSSEPPPLYRADLALKTAAASVLELRNAACEKQLVPAQACRLPNWPSWPQEPPTAATPIEELDRRSTWLFDVMKPFAAAGCAAGQKAFNDEHFCSVE